MAGLAGGTAAQGWSLRLPDCRVRWASTDQVPQALVDAGSCDGRPFGRFDSVDPTAGGNTGSSSMAAEWHGEDSTGRIRIGLFDAVARRISGSRRHGVEFNNRWTPLPWFLLDADFAWTHARFDNGERIANSLDRVASVAVTLRELGPWSASLQWRYLGPGPLVEDNSVRSLPSLTTNLRVSRKLGATAELTLDLFNLLDRRINDIQYVYESQPRGLAAAQGRHVHPAERRSLRATLQLRF